ncbi:MAG: hypothetical protein AAGL98_08275, partial [Planctomycetota bacterium]
QLVRSCCAGLSIMIVFAGVESTRVGGSFVPQEAAEFIIAADTPPPERPSRPLADLPQKSIDCRDNAESLRAPKEKL